MDDRVRFYYKIRNDISVENGIVYFNNRIIIPSSLRKTMLNLLHESHQGITKSKLRAKEVMYWPGMLQEIEQLISNCRICEKFSSANRKDPLIPHEVPNLPFQKVGCDILTYQNKDYLVLIDYYSKWIELRELNCKSASGVIMALKSIFSVHGIPKTLISDNMPFSSYEFKLFTRAWNFSHITSSPNYPRSNGESEKAVHIVKQMLKKKTEEGKDIYISLLEYRSTPIPHIGLSPSEMLMSRLLRTKLPASDFKLQPKVHNNIVVKLKSYQEKYKTYHDKQAKINPMNYVPDQNVIIKRYNDKTWAPGKVVGLADTPRSYIVQDDTGKLLRRNSYHLKHSMNEPVVTGNSFEEPVIANDGNKTNSSFASLNNELQMCGDNNDTSLTGSDVTTRSGRVVKAPSKYRDYI